MILLLCFSVLGTLHHRANTVPSQKRTINTPHPVKYKLYNTQKKGDTKMEEKNEKKQPYTILKIRELITQTPHTPNNQNTLKRLENIKQFILNNTIKGSLSSADEVAKTLFQNPETPITEILLSNKTTLTRDNFYKAIARYDKHFTRATGGNFIENFISAHQKSVQGDSEAFKNIDRVIGSLPRMFRPDKEDFAPESLKHLFYEVPTNPNLTLEDCVPELLFFAKHSKMMLTAVAEGLDQEKMMYIYRLLRGVNVPEKRTTTGERLEFSDEEVATARRIVSRYAENNADKEIDELYGR